MTEQGYISKIRHWDNQMAKWMMRHFYFIFFQAVLLIIFFFWFVNMFSVLSVSFDIEKTDKVHRMLISQSINTTIIVLLMLLNSFWTLYMFNTLLRMHSVLKDVAYNINRLRRNSQPDNKS